jgi:ribosomal protein S8
MGFVSNSQKDLIASLQLCVTLDKGKGRAVYSKFNLTVLSFLCQRGFVSTFKFFKEGSGGYVLFSLRRVNGVLLFNKVWSPSTNGNYSISRFSKYKSYRALSKVFTSEFVVVSTNRGLMTANEAISMKLGGLVVCVIT